MYKRWLCRDCGHKWNAHAVMSCPNCKEGRSIERIEVEDEIKVGRSAELERIKERYGDKDDI